MLLKILKLLMNSEVLMYPEEQYASLKCSVLDFINFMTIKLSPTFPNEKL